MVGKKGIARVGYVVQFSWIRSAEKKLPSSIVIWSTADVLRCKFINLVINSISYHWIYHSQRNFPAISRPTDWSTDYKPPTDWSTDYRPPSDWSTDYRPPKDWSTDYRLQTNWRLIYRLQTAYRLIYRLQTTYRLIYRLQTDLQTTDHLQTSLVITSQQDHSCQPALL